MFIFNKFVILFYALLFGLSGLPAGFYILRKKNFNLFEKIIFGYFIGISLTPLLFVFELFLGLKFSLTLIYLNWAIVFLAGLALFLYSLLKEKKSIKLELSSLSSLKINEEFFSIILVAILMLAIFLIGYSNSGIPIMDLDPYFYLDGVRQVIYEGYNYFDDKTAWYPEPISSHVGNPVWKYTIASWFSLYNQNEPYDLYKLIAVGSVFPPIIGALAVFFSYLLFKELYDRKTALLVGALIAFSPIMLIKFQGGDFQIEPYNILALVCAFYGLIYYLNKKSDLKDLAIFFLCLIPIYLGSNLFSFFSLILGAFLILYTIADFLRPKKESDFQKIIKILAVAGFLALIYFLYLISSKVSFTNSLSSIASLLAVLIGTPIIYYILDRFKKEASYQKFLILLIIFTIALAAGIIGIQIPQIKEMVLRTIGVAGYTVPLVRTIAEQAPGPASFADALGFFGQDFVVATKTQSFISGEYIKHEINLIDGNSILIKLYNYMISYFATLSFPAVSIDFIYNLFTSTGNIIFGKNTYEYIPKNISVTTAAAFFAILLIISKTLYKIKNNKEWDLDLILVILFFGILIISFGKQKFVMYSVFVTIMFIGICFGLIQQIFKQLIKLYKKETLKNYTLALHLLIGILALIAKPELLAAGLFIIAAGAILILLFYEYAIEKIDIFFWGITLFLVLCQFFGPFLFSGQLININNNEIILADFGKLASEYGLSAYPLLINSFIPRIYDDVDKVLPLLAEDCKKSGENSHICYAIEQIKQKNYTALNPAYYYNSEMCRRSIKIQLKDQEEGPDKQYAYSYRCSMINPYWIDSMYWIATNTEKDARIISWWDYGHWINFFGQRNTVLRNEQASLEMIGKTAAAFLHKDINFLKQTMKEYGSKYILIDAEIVGSGTDKNNIILGGKYHALNYLGCAWQNKTNVTFYPGQSECEQEHTWEQVIIPTNTQTCVISKDKNITGLVGYRQYYKNQKIEFLPTYCFTQEYTAAGP
ncbi:MAG: hypothetical protein N3D10_03520, partial [Candidatus Micrarchaeota archaeon]|nr:hypothetical protein [Candidatus Micrarchaeota archaeon]